MMLVTLLLLLLLLLLAFVLLSRRALRLLVLIVLELILVLRLLIFVLLLGLGSDEVPHDWIWPKNGQRLIRVWCISPRLNQWTKWTRSGLVRRGSPRAFSSCCHTGVVVDRSLVTERPAVEATDLPVIAHGLLTNGGSCLILLRWLRWVVVVGLAVLRGSSRMAMFTSLPLLLDSEGFPQEYIGFSDVSTCELSKQNSIACPAFDGLLLILVDDRNVASCERNERHRFSQEIRG